jgi:hypothetical protein
LDFHRPYRRPFSIPSSRTRSFPAPLVPSTSLLSIALGYGRSASQEAGFSSLQMVIGWRLHLPSSLHL